jgi:hypothetical protein
MALSDGTGRATRHAANIIRSAEIQNRHQLNANIQFLCNLPVAIFSGTALGFFLDHLEASVDALERFIDTLHLRLKRFLLPLQIAHESSLLRVSQFVEIDQIYRKSTHRFLRWPISLNQSVIRYANAGVSTISRG